MDSYESSWSTYAVEFATHVNRTILNDIVDQFRQRRVVLRIGELERMVNGHVSRASRAHFGVEKDFRSEKAFVANVDREGLLRHRINARVLQVVLAWIFIVFGKLLGNVRTDITVAFLQRTVGVVRTE